MNSETTNLDELIAQLNRREERNRIRRLALYAIPIAAAIFLLYSSTLERLYLSFKYHVAFDQVDLAKEQTALWAKNLNCTQPMTPQTTLSDGTNVSIAACPSGDILLLLTNPNGSSLYRFISRRGLLENRSS